MSTMLTPSLHSPEDRGKRWLQAKVQEILAASAVVLATPHAEGAPVCYWGTGPATGTTLYFSQHNAILLIRRTLKKMGILPA